MFQLVSFAPAVSAVLLPIYLLPLFPFWAFKVSTWLDILGPGRSLNSYSIRNISCFPSQLYDDMQTYTNGYGTAVDGREDL